MKDDKSLVLIMMIITFFGKEKAEEFFKFLKIIEEARGEKLI